jgi:hypothetical protein
MDTITYCKIKKMSPQLLVADETIAANVLYNLHEKVYECSSANDKLLRLMQHH